MEIQSKQAVDRRVWSHSRYVKWISTTSDTHVRWSKETGKWHETVGSAIDTITRDIQIFPSRNKTSAIIGLWCQSSMSNTTTSTLFAMTRDIRLGNTKSIHRSWTSRKTGSTRRGNIDHDRARSAEDSSQSAWYTEDFPIRVQNELVWSVLAFVQDKERQSKDAETQYNRLETMQNRTKDISRQYWTLNDQYRLLNTTIVEAMANHQKIKDEYDTKVRTIVFRRVRQGKRCSLECHSKFEYRQGASRCWIDSVEIVHGFDQQSIRRRSGEHPRYQISSRYSRESHRKSVGDRQESDEQY